MEILTFQVTVSALYPHQQDVVERRFRPGFTTLSTKTASLSFTGDAVEMKIALKPRQSAYFVVQVSPVVG